MYQSRIRATKKRNQAKNRELIEPGDGQSYGVVQDMLGNGRIRIYCDDKETRVGRIRGSMRKYSGKVLIEKGDLILYAGRDFAPDMLDVFHKFKHDEVAVLLKRECLPETIVKMLHMDIDDETSKPKDDYVMFVDQGSDAEAESTVGSGASDAESDIDIDDI